MKGTVLSIPIVPPWATQRIWAWQAPSPGWSSFEADLRPGVDACPFIREDVPVRWLRERAKGFRAMKNETADLFAAALENAADAWEER